MTEFKSIAFIGGIHGVGKSTLCNAVCQETGWVYLLASDVLKWKDLRSEDGDKRVRDVVQTQDRLVVGLRNIVDTGNRYLLDGHYCLLSKDNTIQKVPIETFRQINPFSLNLIIDDIALIKERLENRDHKLYDLGLLRYMQDTEISHAKAVSEALRIKLNISTPADITALISSIKKDVL